MFSQPLIRSVRRMKNRFDSLSGIASLSLTLTLSGCAWVSPSQWFGGNEQCDPDDRSGGLSAACAKESLATQERSSQRLVCMGDDTDQAWICGNNMEEVLAQLAEQNPAVLTKNKAPSSTDTSTDLSPANTEALGPSTDANPPQLALAKQDVGIPPESQQPSEPQLDDETPLQPALHRETKRAAIRRPISNRNQVRVSRQLTLLKWYLVGTLSMNKPTLGRRHPTMSGYSVAFGRNREHFGMPQSLSVTWTKRLTCSKASHKKDRRLGTGWS